jgi:hypothetical protein
MATTFTTTILNLYTVQQPDPDYVVNVLWQVKGVDGAYICAVQGTTQFDSSQQQGPIIPYDQLTQEIVIGWIPAEEISNAQASSQAQINTMISPPVNPQNTPLPWA